MPASLEASRAGMHDRQAVERADFGVGPLRRGPQGRRVGRESVAQRDLPAHGRIVREAIRSRDAPSWRAGTIFTAAALASFGLRSLMCRISQDSHDGFVMLIVNSAPDTDRVATQP